jgi:hypothetical protein
MKVRVLGFWVLVVILGLSLSACSCARQAMKGEEAPPPPVAEKVVAPAAAVCPECKPCPPPVVCPEGKVCPTCPVCPEVKPAPAPAKKVKG